MRTLLIGGLLLCACPPRPQAVDAGAPPIVDAGSMADAGEDDLSSLLEPLRVQGALPALAAAVIRGDSVIALGTTGVRKLGDPMAAGLDDKWHLGSDTKAMTATLAGLAVERGTVRLEDTLSTLFAGETLDPSWRDVTLEQLLQHRGGAPADVPPAIWSQLWADGSRPDALIRAVRAMLALPAETPGTYRYSNAGYMIAGAAVELRWGQGWEDLMRTQLFTPLGMSSCGFGAAGSATGVDQPWGHRGTPLQPVAPGPGADNPRGLGPAGTVHCSLRDWGRFISLHLAGARGEDRLLTSATIKRLHTPPTGGDYAAGWLTPSRSWAGGVALTHAGSNTMNYAVAWLAPTRNVAFLVTSNVSAATTPAAVDAVFGPLIQRYAP